MQKVWALICFYRVNISKEKIIYKWEMYVDELAIINRYIFLYFYFEILKLFKDYLFVLTKSYKIYSKIFLNMWFTSVYAEDIRKDFCFNQQIIMI